MEKTKKNLLVEEGGFRDPISPTDVTEQNVKQPLTELVGKITLSGEEIEQLFGIDAGTMANYRSRREGCRFFKVNRRVFYRRDDFEKWFFSNPVLTIDSLPDYPERR